MSIHLLTPAKEMMEKMQLRDRQLESKGKIRPAKESANWGAYDIYLDRLGKDIELNMLKPLKHYMTYVRKEKK